MEKQEMVGVREYCEHFEVELVQIEDRWVVIAWNEGGCNATHIDLLDLIAWLKEHKPELLR